MGRIPRIQLGAGAGGRAARAALTLGVLAAAAAAAALASPLSAGAAVAGSPPSTSDPSALVASPEGAPVSGPSGWTCTYTNPEYMIHSGGATLAVQPGAVRFTVTSAPSGQWSDPYITTGYDVDLNSQLCDSRVLPGSSGQHGWSYALPARLGATGAIVASVHDVTSAGFSGDTGFDIWFEPDPAINTYDQMANQGAAATEIMIWLSHPGLGTQSSNPRYYPVGIDGRRWQVTAQPASGGHGQTAGHPNGWNRVNFIAPQVSEGTVSVMNLYLNPFFSYAAAHGWLRGGDYLMAIDQGGEFTHGTMQVAGYALTGVK